MRYTFAQLLELQNELNLKIDYDKVDEIVDLFLETLEEWVRKTPTRKKYTFAYVCPEGELPISFTFLTQSEIQQIVKELEVLGFQNIEVEDRVDASVCRQIRISVSWE